MVQIKGFLCLLLLLLLLLLSIISVLKRSPGSRLEPARAANRHTFFLSSISDQPGVDVSVRLWYLVYACMHVCMRSESWILPWTGQEMLSKVVFEGKAVRRNDETANDNCNKKRHPAVVCLMLLYYLLWLNLNLSVWSWLLAFFFCFVNLFLICIVTFCR